MLWFLGDVEDKHYEADIPERGPCQGSVVTVSKICGHCDNAAL